MFLWTVIGVSGHGDAQHVDADGSCCCCWTRARLHPAPRLLLPTNWPTISPSVVRDTLLIIIDVGRRTARIVWTAGELDPARRRRIRTGASM